MSIEEFKSAVLATMSSLIFKREDGTLFELAQSMTQVRTKLTEAGVRGLGNSGDFISKVEAAGFGFCQKASYISGNRSAQVFYVKP